MTRFDLAVLILRLIFGVSMAAHGLNKARGGLEGTQKWFASIGMRSPWLQARTAASAEVASGTLMALGLFSALSCSVIIALMLVAIFTVHWRIGYFIFLPGGGWEYCAAIIAVATAVSLVGPGSVALDELLGAPFDVGAWALPVGVVMAVCHLTLFWRPTKGAAHS